MKPTRHPARWQQPPLPATDPRDTQDGQWVWADDDEPADVVPVHRDPRGATP